MADVIISVDITSPGRGYAVNDTLTIPAKNVGAGGSGGTCDVATLAESQSSAETGDNYLLLADTDTSGDVYIYSDEDTGWSGSGIINLGSTTGMKPTFYYVDGALRISDGSFANSNKWYGYIERDLFPGVNTYSIDQWKETKQKIDKPLNTSRFFHEVVITSASYQYVYETAVGGSVQSYSVADDGTLGTANISRITVTYTAVSDDAEREYTGNFQLKAGGHDGSVYTGVVKYSSGSFNSSYSGHTDEQTVEVLFVKDDINVDGNNTTNPKNVKVEITDLNEFGGGTLKITNVKYESTSTSVVAHSDLADENVVLEIVFSTPSSSDASGWAEASGGATWYWEAGVSFIYDGQQESLIQLIQGSLSGTDDTSAAAATMTDSTASFVTNGLAGWTINNTTDNSSAIVASNTATVVTGTLSGGTNNNWDSGDAYILTGTSMAAPADQAPDINFYIKYSDGWNPRITGAKLYMRKIQADETSKWYPQIEYDFVKGTARAYLNDVTTDVEYDPDNDEYIFSIPNEQLQQPNTFGSYQSETGYKHDEESIISKYNTALVANRRAYIGDIEVQKEDGTVEVMGDTMIKSPVNKFDILPLSNIIEASVRDGDKIIKIEEYADRLLQFKKNKLHIINIAQDIEFLEDTLMYKGVGHPAATCKTDFGIAWVNTHGCYLYDGQKVSNLLEKDGRQMIKESVWTTFTANTPMIGYIPQKRQLIVVDDNTSAGNGATYLYDMVTRSWTKGSDGTFTSGNLTNFINDWDGTLIHGHSTGTIKQWDDASASSADTLMQIKSKDIDFGYPSQRKKVYKIYITYKSNGASNVTVTYDTDGGTAFANNFEDSTYFTSTKLLTTGGDWALAELKPSTASQANNIKSIQLKLVANGTVPSTFEVNDMAIVYRLKHIK